MGACLVKQDSNSRGSAVVPYSSPPGKQACLRLYGDETCPFTARIRIALEFKGIPVQVSWVNSKDNDDDDHNDRDISYYGKGKARRCLQYDEEKMNLHDSKVPETKFPVLVYRDHRICGSSDAILECIETNFPKPSLRAHHKDVSAMVAFVRDTFSPAITKALYSNVDDDDDDGSDCTEKELGMACAKLDAAMAKHTSKGPYFYGNRFTLVDVYLVPFLLLDRPLAYLRGIEISPNYVHLRSYSARMTSFASYAPIRMDVDLLKEQVSKVLSQDLPPPLVSFTQLQHKSMLRHFQNLVLSVDEVMMAMKEPSRAVDPVRGSLAMQLKKLSMTYASLLELMLEHAQMEERVIFPSLEKADRGITKSANESHARHLPLMNGIKEDFKGVASLEKGSPGIKEALQAVASRLRTLQTHNIEHFREEETELLPLLNASGMGSKQQGALVGKCIEIMESAHGSKFAFLLSALPPHRIHQYLDLLHKSLESERQVVLKRIMVTLKQSGDDEFTSVWHVVKSRVPALASMAS